MAAEDISIPTKQSRERTTCFVCQKKMTNPRMLPCLHTFCLDCLKDVASKEEKKPGEDMPCPNCRTRFTIPATGFGALQENLFLERLIETEQVSGSLGTNVLCDVCSTSEADVADENTCAVKYCITCRDKLCFDCARHHKKQKLSRDHQIVDIRSEMEVGTFLNKSIKENCRKHTSKLLDTYCTDCCKVVCALCFLKDHERHKGMDINEAEEEFRQEIERDILVLESCELGVLEKKTILKRTADEFLQRMNDIENSIGQAGKELTELIDKQTEALKSKALSFKGLKLKQFQKAMTEIDSYLSLMVNYKLTCDDVKTFGFPSDICRLENALRHRAYKLIEKHDKVCNKDLSTNVSFKTIETGPIKEDFRRILEYDNVLHLFVIWPSYGLTASKDTFDVSLSPPDSKTQEASIPTAAQAESAAVIHENIMFVTGIGSSSCEIWKWGGISSPSMFSWSRCKDMPVSRNGHCVTFTKEQLYLIGGYTGRSGNVLDSVVAYDPKTNSCVTVGKLVHGVQNAACVSWNDSIYVFGGSGTSKMPVDYVQVYKTTDNTCTVLSMPMPSPQSCMRAAICKEQVILLGSEACFIFDLAEEMWLERTQFKTDVVHFGLALHNGRIFVFGGGKREDNPSPSKSRSPSPIRSRRPSLIRSRKLSPSRSRSPSPTSTWTCRDDIRCIPLLNFVNDIPTDWKVHGKLPKKCMIHSYCSKTLQKVTTI